MSIDDLSYNRWFIVFIVFIEFTAYSYLFVKFVNSILIQVSIIFLSYLLFIICTFSYLSLNIDVIYYIIIKKYA